MASSTSLLPGERVGPQVPALPVQPAGCQSAAISGGIHAIALVDLPRLVRGWLASVFSRASSRPSGVRR
jgi:hypothetical protein